MTGDGALVGAEEAATIAGVPIDRLAVLVEEGLLTVQDRAEDEPRYLRAEVQALGHLGG